MCRYSLSSSPSTRHCWDKMLSLLCHPNIQQATRLDLAVSLLSAQDTAPCLLSSLKELKAWLIKYKIQTKFLIFQIDKWFPGVLILTNVISHNRGWEEAVPLVVVILVLLELTHDLQLLMSLYIRDSQCSDRTHSNICRCINNIITHILRIVGSWECCTALSSIVNYQWQISTKPELLLLSFNPYNIELYNLIKVNIETFLQASHSWLQICEG